MALGKKLFELAHLHHKIVMRGARADLHGFHGGALLGKPFFLEPLFFFVAELIVAHQARNGRFCICGNLDEIEAFFRSHEGERFLARQNAEIFSFLVDHAQFLRGYLAVNAWFGNGCRGLCANVNSTNSTSIVAETLPFCKWADTAGRRHALWPRLTAALRAAAWPCYNKPMDEGPITHPGVPEEIYHTLGRKTFWIFFIQRLNGAIVFLLISIVLFAIQGQPFLITKQFGNISPYVTLAAVACLVIFAVMIFIILLGVWIEYANYKYCLGEDSLKIKRGFLNKEEVAIPYRQIQDVDIRRDLYFQMLGLSRIIILTAGQEDETPRDSESEGILPALDSSLAEWFQAELLRRANVQKVIEEKVPAA